MKSILYFGMISLSLVFQGCRFGGTDYYLSPDGDDSAKGTSPSNAWKSISNINNISFKPGDRILFKGNSVFTGSPEFGADDSGTPDKPVTIGTYGEGRATISSGSRHGLYAYNTSGFVVQDLIFEGAGANVDADFSGILFFTDLDTVKPEYIRINNVEVSGYRWNGIAIHGERKGSSGFRDVRVSNCKVHDNGDKGISVSGPQPPGEWGNKDFYIGDCRVYDTRGISGKKGHSGNGIIVSSVDGCLIEYCTAYNNGEFSDDPQTGGPIGIWAWDSRDVIIQFCESYNNRTGNRADGGGFDLDGGCVDCIMQYNYSHGNDGAGYGIYQYNGAREFRNNIIRYNISQNDGVKNRHGGIDLWSTNSSGGMQNTRIYNNTIYVSENTNGAAIADLPDAPDTCYIYGTQVCNNIFVGVPGKKLVDIPNPSDQWSFRGNCYWTYGNQVQIQWGDETFTSLEEWRRETGQERSEGAGTGFESDPELTHPGQGGTVGDPHRLNTLNAYILKQSSPLIDQGLDIKSILGEDPGLQDFYGTIVPDGNRYDIGAHEAVKENPGEL